MKAVRSPPEVFEPVHEIQNQNNAHEMAPHAGSDVFELLLVAIDQHGPNPPLLGVTA
jgi:hypothetical protein